MHAPPPPVQRPRSAWPVALTILGLGTVFLLIICGVGAYAGFNQFNKVPQARKGFGKPEVVAKMDAGWSRYRLPEIPVELDLPARPTPGKLDYESAHGFLVTEWIYYSCASELNGLELTGHWGTALVPVDLEDELQDIEWYASGGAPDTDIQSTHERKPMGELNGYKSEGTFTRDGNKTKFFGYHWVEANAAFHFFAYCWLEDAPHAEREFDRIIKSVKTP